MFGPPNWKNSSALTRPPKLTQQEKGLVNNVFMSMYSGWQLVVLSRFDLEKACQVIQDYKITFAYIPPPVVLALSKEAVVDKYDLTSLKILHCGAAPITSELIEMVWSRLKVPVKQGYGLSEASPVSHVQPPDEWAKFMTSVGKLVPNMESKIVDTGGKEVALGEVCGPRALDPIGLTNILTQDLITTARRTLAQGP